MGHAKIERIPEVTKSTRLSAGHAEVVDVAGEVCLARHANVGSISSSSTIVTVSFVVTGANHIWSISSDGSHLIVESVKD
jgi:hypothetical protein